MKRTLILTAVLILSVLPAFAQQAGAIKNADKSELIRLILEDARIYKGYLFSNGGKAIVYFSSENIARNLVPTKIGKTALVLKSPKEIEKADPDHYCAFGKFKIERSTANVSFYYHTKKSSGEGFDREVLEYEFSKVGGKWKFISRKHPGLRLGSS